MNCTNCNDHKPYKKRIEKKDLIIKELKKRGMRITSQRKIILDIILEKECSCCKEIYYQAVMRDSSMGIATVYRMLKILEEIGAIDRKNLFHISYENLEDITEGEILLMEQNKETKLKWSDQKEGKEWFLSLKKWMREMGYLEDEEISVVIKKNKKSSEQYHQKIS